MDSVALTGHGVTLLLIEGERRVRRAMRLLLTALADLGTVEVATTAEAALRRVATLPPGVAVVDLSLPDLSSDLQLLRTLASAGWAVLAMSTQSGLSGTALAHGASAFVDKGVDPDEIVRLVRELVAQTTDGVKKCHRSC